MRRVTMMLGALAMVVRSAGGPWPPPPAAMPPMPPSAKRSGYLYYTDANENPFKNEGDAPGTRPRAGTGVYGEHLLRPGIRRPPRRESPALASRPTAILACTDVLAHGETNTSASRGQMRQELFQLARPSSFASPTTPER